ncbi:retrovirus-related pol polyprotein from transposon TNT 1-94 [Tanacetum coccineum]
MMKSSPICLFSKASKTKSWLWHRRLSHLNFGNINQLAKQGLVRGLPKLKYEKDHLCFACSLGKSKKHTHKPKSEDTIQEKLYLLHMDLCGPMRVESINGKKYILVIPEEDELKGLSNLENSNVVERKEEQRGTPQPELKDQNYIEKIRPSRNDKEREIEWLDVEEPLDLVDTSEESVYESLIKEMPKCSLNYDFRIKKGD